MSRALVDLLPASLAWVAALYKLAGLRRRPGDTGLRFVCLTLTLVAVALTAGLPPVYRRIDHLLGIPNIAQLIKGSLALIGGWSVQRYFIHLAGDDAEAEKAGIRSNWVLAGTLGLLCLLFALAPVDVTEPVDFTTHYARKPYVLEYEIVILAYMGLIMYSIAERSRVYANLVRHKPATYLGMWFTAAGGATSILYVLQSGSYSVARRYGLAYPLPNPELLSDLLKAVLLAFLLLGATLPAWGTRMGIPRIPRWVEQYRDCRALYPLWADICRAMPDLALVGPHSSLVDALDARDIRFRLRRRVVEICDGYLVLQPFIDPGVLDLARRCAAEAGLSGEEAEAIVDAAGLAAALRASEAGVPVCVRSPRRAGPMRIGFAAELAYLRKVARCYKRSEIVQDLLDESRTRGRVRELHGASQ